MKISRMFGLSAALAACAALSGCVASLDSDKGVSSNPDERAAFAADVVSQWSQTASLAARRLMERYGPPDEVRRDRLAWRGNAPWEITTVSDAWPQLDQATDADLGVVAQTVRLSLTPFQAAAAVAAAADERVTYDPVHHELTARSDREEVNILRLNLAVDAAQSRLSVAEARQQYARDLMLEASGKVLPDMQVLRFTPDR